MFENLFKKDRADSDAAATAPMPGDAQPQTPPAISADELQAWRERITAAASDEAALLQLAHEAPSVELKLAAIQALTREDSFKHAMREFRDQDKRLYRAAKSRWQEASGKRETVAEARDLIASARALLEQALVPANRVVELDRAWAGLNAAWLDAGLPAEFAAVRGELGTKVRARGEGEQALIRWLAAVDHAIGQLRASLAAVAQGDTPPAEAATLAAALLELLSDVQDAGDARGIEKTDAANRALALASSVVQRAEFLQSLPAPGVADEANEKGKIEQWRGFPEVAETELQSVLALRFADWRNASTHVRQHEDETHRAHEREASAEQKQLRVSAVQRDVEAAEAALAAGNVADLTRLVTAIDHALKSGGVNSALTQRIKSLRQEQSRLRGWQRWGDAQRREQLVAEAQALAGAATGKVAVKAHAEAIDKLRERWKELDKLGGATNQALWLAFDGALKSAYAPVAAHLDKLKAARSENLDARNRIVDSLVQAAARFFPAVQADPAPAAGPDPAPVAGADPAPAAGADPAPVAGADPAPVAGAEPAATAGADPAPAAGADPAPAAGADPAPAAGAAEDVIPAPPEGGTRTPSARPDWRGIARTLEEAQTAWRKLGPVEHTVPRKAQRGDNAVTTRYAQAAQALEAPLEGAYREATGQREQLIAAARNLAGAGAAARDTVDKVRKLQAQWQTSARSLTLPRRDENRLWTEFKTATDAIFTERDAARAAKDNEFSAQIKAREAIIERLLALAAATAPEVKRAMAEADTAWRAAAVTSKPHAAKLDARYRAARDAASKQLAALATHASQARFDALIAKLALCDEREAAADAGSDTGSEAAAAFEARWNAIENFPDAWKKPLDARFLAGDASPAGSGPASGSGNNSGAGLAEILLKLEVALGIESPAEFVAARHQLKLRALKDAMEGRQAAVTTPADIERWLLDAAATPRPDQAARERLAKIIAAVRLRRPG